MGSDLRHCASVGNGAVQADCSCDAAMTLMLAEADRRETNIEDIARNSPQAADERQAVQVSIDEHYARVIRRLLGAPG